MPCRHFPTRFGRAIGKLVADEMTAVEVTMQYERGPYKTVQDQPSPQLDMGLRRSHWSCVDGNGGRS